jgi:hypothetical protein
MFETWRSVRRPPNDGAKHAGVLPHSTKPRRFLTPALADADTPDAGVSIELPAVPASHGQFRARQAIKTRTPPASRRPPAAFPASTSQSLRAPQRPVPCSLGSNLLLASPIPAGPSTPRFLSQSARLGRPTHPPAGHRRRRSPFSGGEVRVIPPRN